MTLVRILTTLTVLLISVSLLGQSTREEQPNGEMDVLILASTSTHIRIHQPGSNVERKVKDRSQETWEEIQKLYNEGWQLISSTGGGGALHEYIFVRKRE
jgi:hypothetical protein